MAGQDFVKVQLTAAGVELAGGHSLRISSGRRHFEFKPDDSGAYPALRVERSYEWHGVLAQQHTPSGLALLELVPQGPALVEASENQGSPAKENV